MLLCSIEVSKTVVPNVAFGSIATGAGQQRVRPCPLCPESER